MERLRGRLHWSARMGYWLASQQGFERVRTGQPRSLVRFARLTQLVCIRLVLGQVRAARKARSGRISFGVFEAALRLNVSAQLINGPFAVAFGQHIEQLDRRRKHDGRTDVAARDM